MRSLSTLLTKLSDLNIIFLKLIVFVVLWSFNLQEILAQYPVNPTRTDTLRMKELFEKKFDYGNFYSGAHHIVFFKLGYVFNRYHGLEIGVYKNRAKILKDSSGFQNKRCWNVGAEFYIKQSALVFTPKLGYEFKFRWLYFRNNLLYFTDFKNSSFKCRPELRLLSSTYFDIYYGYNFAITNKEFMPLKHNISVGLSLAIFSRKYKAFRLSSKEFQFYKNHILEYPYTSIPQNYILEHSYKSVPEYKSKPDYSPKIQCPCCDYITFSSPSELHVCDICFWQNDGTSIDSLDVYSSHNRMTLREARNNFKEFGACEKALLQYVLPVEQRKKYKYRPRDIR